MSTMSKKIGKALAVSAIGLAMAHGAVAATVTFQQVDGYFSGKAGEFTAQHTPFVGNYAASATATLNGTIGFQTFCLELNEIMRLNRAYDYTVDMAAIEGGVSGGNPDPLSLGSAWLYSEFAAGTLAGYEYAPGAGRELAAGQLQDAFWWLEDEITLADPNANMFLAAAFAQFGDQTAAKADATAGAYNVWVMNPTDNGEPRQSVLVIRVPDGGLTLGLLGLSLAGIARLRKRFSTAG